MRLERNKAGLVSDRSIPGSWSIPEGLVVLIHDRHSTRSRSVRRKGKPEMVDLTKKRGLGPVVMGGKQMPWSKGAMAGGFVFLSGLEGRTTDEDDAVEGVAAQTKLALDRGKQYLEEVGGSFEDVVRMTQYLANPALAGDFHKARNEWMAEHAPGLLEQQSYGGVLLIQQFTKPDRLIELEVTAYLGARAE